MSSREPTQPQEGEFGPLSLEKSVSRPSRKYFSPAVLTLEAYFDPRSESRTERAKREAEKLKAQEENGEAKAETPQVNTPS